MLSPPLLLLSYLLPLLSLSPRDAGEWDHPRSDRLCCEAGNVQKASGLGPQGRRRRCSHHGVGAEGAGRPPRGSVSSGTAPDAHGAGLPPAHLPHLGLRSQQPAAKERHVLLESWHANTVDIYTRMDEHVCNIFSHQNQNQNVRGNWLQFANSVLL